MSFEKYQRDQAAKHSRDYRARRREQGLPTARGKRTSSGKKYSLFADGEFIAIDGEGESVGEPEIFVLGQGTEYRAAAHHYTLLAASTGDKLRAEPGKRLATRDALDFLLSLAARNKRGIFVAFAGSYDFNHVLAFGIDRPTLARIARGERVRYDFSDGDGLTTYEIEYRARKSLSVKRGLSWTVDGKGKHKPKWEASIIVWDVFGFFQENFVNVMSKWLGKDNPDFALIQNMKARRGDFANVPDALIEEYNDAELRCLVQIMEKVREGVRGLDLQVTRWDGAGAIAGAMMKKHNIKEFKAPTPDHIMLAVRTAYAGGRIEACKIGHHSMCIYKYDLNSAYPSKQKDCPCLAHGRWLHRGKTANTRGFTLVKLKWDFPLGLPFYPLFFRDDHKRITFPSAGCGWYWAPEYEAARYFELQYKEQGALLEVLDCWEFLQECDHQPFEWVPVYYETRQQFINQPHAPEDDWKLGAEKNIKLGLNSLYGKTAQQLGWNVDKEGELRLPAYHQLAWAGYITSGVRAELVKAALQKPSSIISFSTDGIYSVAPLDLNVSKTKVLGAWEFERLDNLTIVMPGVYWYPDPKRKKPFEHYSRGFDKDTMATPQIILDAWQARKTTLAIPMQRLIGMLTATQSDTLWQMRGRFVTGTRNLDLVLNSSAKRRSISHEFLSGAVKPWRELVSTKARDCVEYNCGQIEISQPYPIGWIDDDLSPEYIEEQRAQQEAQDMENI